MRRKLTAPFKWIVRACAALAREFNAHTILFFSAVAMVGYGVGLIYRPAGFIAAGVIVVWWTLPSRPPFVARPAARRQKE